MYLYVQMNDSNHIIGLVLVMLTNLNLEEQPWLFAHVILLSSASLNGTFSYFTSWKYSYHYTHKHSLFVLYNTK